MSRYPSSDSCHRSGYRGRISGINGARKLVVEKLFIWRKAHFVIRALPGRRSAAVKAGRRGAVPGRSNEVDCLIEPSYRIPLARASDSFLGSLQRQFSRSTERSDLRLGPINRFLARSDGIQPIAFSERLGRAVRRPAVAAGNRPPDRDSSTRCVFSWVGAHHGIDRGGWPSVPFRRAEDPESLQWRGGSMGAQTRLCNGNLLNSERDSGDCPGRPDPGRQKRGVGTQTVRISLAVQRARSSVSEFQFRGIPQGALGLNISFAFGIVSRR